MIRERARRGGKAKVYQEMKRTRRNAKVDSETNQAFFLRKEGTKQKEEKELTALARVLSSGIDKVVGRTVVGTRKWCHGRAAVVAAPQQGSCAWVIAVIALSFVWRGFPAWWKSQGKGVWDNARRENCCTGRARVKKRPEVSSRKLQLEFRVSDPRTRCSLREILTHNIQDLASH